MKNINIIVVLLVTVSGLICQVVAVASSPATISSTDKPQGFSARSADVGDEDDDVFDSQAQTQYAYRQQQQQPQHLYHQQQVQPQHQQHHQQQQQQQQQPLYDYSQSEEVEQDDTSRQSYQNPSRQVYKQQQNYIKSNGKNRASSEETEELEEEEEPDRLSTLLAKSSFQCTSKNSGYYADESLSCEVFHYCQDNQKHSWICPEGFTFHQIHLICMPPSHDNICKQSSKYHIVNDYLYKPINLQEHQSKPNVTLRYSNRYFPESYDYDRNAEYDDEEAPRQRSQQHRQPIQVGFRSQQFTPQVQQQQQPQQTTAAYTQQPAEQQQAALYQQQQQQQQQQQTRQPIQKQVRYQQVPTKAPHITPVYRRPVPQQPTTIQVVTTTTSKPPSVTQQHRTPTYEPYISPTPYRFYTAAPQLSQPQQVYRTPEEINISLQQRRPQFFVATPTPRFYEDDYLYERRK